MRKELELEGGSSGIDGVGVGKEVLQVLCKLFSQTIQTKTRKTKDLATLT